MSGLEKFQSSEAWRTNFKKLLFMERKPEIVQKPVTITQSQRYSLDIAEDLKNIIEQKKNKKTAQTNLNVNDENINISKTAKSFQKTETSILEAKTKIKENMNRYDDTVYEGMQNTSDVSFEALEKMCEKTASDPNSTLFKYLNAGDEQKSNNVLVWQKTSDESFEALERMCDKTASDPNSTLFQYLHSDRKEQILAEAKKRSADGLVLSDPNEDDSLFMKINNYTILDDIEAPSRLWESTICGDINPQTSPVKMVGLLRPSTIIEEAPDESANFDVSSQASFHTATKSAQGDVSSSAYESAHDSTNASNRYGGSNEYRSQELDGLDVDQILLTALAKNEQMQQDNEVEIVPTLEAMNATVVEAASLRNKCEGESCDNSGDISINLIDLDKTFKPLSISASPHSSALAENKDEANQNLESFENKLEDELENKLISYNISDSSIIEITSDDDEDIIENEQNINNMSFDNQQFLNNNIKTEICSESKCNTFSSSDTDNECDKENFAETNETSEKSMQFNDTIEEVEYMIKKGQEYMAAKATARTSPEKKKTPLSASNNQVSKTHPSSPMKQSTVRNISSATKVFDTYTTPLKNTPLNKDANSTSKLHDFVVRPFPKLEVFAKPLPHARPKEVTNKQQKFSHIVSPIGTYIKKTARTPLMSSMSCQNKNYFNSSAILELENESRMYQPRFETDFNAVEAMGLPKLPGLPSGAKRPLPKKAYISSDYKHIVDERTPVTIPGGKKIQQYLENAMMPAVLRHEGKLKMPGEISNKLSSPTPAPSKLPLKISETNSSATKPLHVPRRNNASLADLSLMSGDVSLYTIMDAQKF